MEYNRGMAANLRLAEILRPHVNLQEFGGWQRHVRPGGFEPVGIVIHHTAGHNDLNTIINGRSDLPGPLANLYFDRDGAFPVTLVSAGRSNHAGAGASVVLEEVRAGTAAGPDAAARGLKDGPGGNFFFYGFEAENLGTGTQDWPEAQYRAMVLCAAAICRFHGWNAGHVIGHREWTRRKPDPRGFLMSTFRWDVHTVLTGAPAPITAPAPQPAPTPPAAPDFKERVMSLPVLKEGASGHYVKIMQALLIVHAGFPGSGVDGQFGPATARSLREWQGRTGKLTADGICGPATWAWLVGV